MPDSVGLATRLRHWTHYHDPHVRAAVELLIEHGYWLRRPDFTGTCVHHDRRQAWVDWPAARTFADAGSTASGTQMAVLDLAVALGENRYKLSIMGYAHSHMMAAAFAQALGLDIGHA
jgi:hypothetical protein